MYKCVLYVYVCSLSSARMYTSVRVCVSSYMNKTIVRALSKTYALAYNRGQSARRSVSLWQNNCLNIQVRKFSYLCVAC